MQREDGNHTDDVFLFRAQPPQFGDLFVDSLCALFPVQQHVAAASEFRWQRRAPRTGQDPVCKKVPHKPDYHYRQNRDSPGDDAIPHHNDHPLPLESRPAYPTPHHSAEQYT